MFKFLKKRKAQSTMEYAVLIIIIIGALLSIQVYIKRGIQGRLRSAADDIGEQFSSGKMNATTTTVSHSKTHDEYATGITTSTLDGKETSNTTVKSDMVGNAQQEFWGGI